MATAQANRPVTKPALLSKSQVAEMLSCSTASIDKLRAAGKMPAPVKIGALPRWKTAELEQWVASGCPSLRPQEQLTPT